MHVSTRRTSEEGANSFSLNALKDIERSEEEITRYEIRKIILEEIQRSSFHVRKNTRQNYRSQRIADRGLSICNNYGKIGHKSHNYRRAPARRTSQDGRNPRAQTQYFEGRNNSFRQSRWQSEN